MAPGFDLKGLGDALQVLSKLIHDPNTFSLKERAAGAIESITQALEKVSAEIDRNGRRPGTTDFSLTLYAARELERYLCGEKTQIGSRRIAEVYYHVLCSGIEEIPRLDLDIR